MYIASRAYQYGDPMFKSDHMSELEVVIKFFTTC